MHHFTLEVSLTYGFIRRKQAQPFFNLIFAVKKENSDTSFHIRICSHIWIYLQKTSTTTF